jgi:hypothetical protein
MSDEHPVPIYLLASKEFPDGRIVSLAEWVEAERLAGFSGPGHFSSPAAPATAGFTGNGYRGLIRYREENEA